MINKTKIKEAADKYCAHLLSETIPRPNCQSWSADTMIFKAGIDWFKENLWHESYEKPKQYTPIVVKSKIDEEYYTCIYCDGEFLCDGFDLSHEEISCWFYINDLVK